MSTTVEKLVDETAYNFRSHIRAKAGLPCDWEEMSEGMYQFYTDRALEYLEANGDIMVKE